ESRRLQVRDVSVRSGRLVHLPVADVAHHSDDFRAAHEAALPETDVLAERVLTGEEAAGSSIVDHDDLRGALSIGFGKPAPAQKRNLHRPEVISRDKMHAD